ncbi:hypothetical protein OIU77_022762 [Salix suchowensis]|uniref:Uncharacterized protein n=1 Tax=Salix suchowensis TaxID=1278906 RepID=A0ABQ9C3G2_9ROSI|nr:hypothetical protein OIU77_022762 [Salix suchowensis]
MESYPTILVFPLHKVDCWAWMFWHNPILILSSTPFMQRDMKLKKRSLDRNQRNFNLTSRSRLE